MPTSNKRNEYLQALNRLQSMQKSNVVLIYKVEDLQKSNVDKIVRAQTLRRACIFHVISEYEYRY